MGYNPFESLNALVQTLRKFELWKPIDRADVDRADGQAFARKYGGHGERRW